jgi:hypothetical protein
MGSSNTRQLGYAFGRSFASIDPFTGIRRGGGISPD